MEGFSLTERMATFLKRTVAINSENFKDEIEQFKHMNNTEFLSQLNADEEFGIIELGSTVINYYSDTMLNIMMQINFWDKNGVVDKNNAYTMIFIKYGKCVLDNFPYDENYDERIDKLIKTFKLCRCGFCLVKKDDWCYDCFPYVISQENNCCVCLENEGVWIQLTNCRHKIHSYCWRNILQNDSKCPLCRTLITDCKNI